MHLVLKKCLGDEGAPLINGDNDLVGIYSHGGACDGADGTPKFMRATYFKNFIETQSCSLGSKSCGVFTGVFGWISMQLFSAWSGVLGVFGF